MPWEVKIPSADRDVDLQATIVVQAAVIAELRSTNASLQARVAELEGRVAELEARLRANSSNSSRPPSSDGLGKGPPKPGRADRRAGVRRKPGGQPGAPGAYLAQVAHPDQVVVHVPDCCERCGGELADAVVGAEARQVFDLPQLGLLVTEHRAERRRCGCGAVTAAAFPEGVDAPPAMVLGCAPRWSTCTASSICRWSGPPRRWPTWSAP
ncbi:MAG TPA: DUF6444 domain-containing protein, partial [Candidatus Binatia bacterium]|nr:DUF6444 domain-containing protein [Candidatus Binatia bacterium]